MLEKIRLIIDFIGISNFISITLFIIGILIAFYFYFNTFFRLVYSTEKICGNCYNVNDWQNKETEFKSRILVLNNGRKTITNKEIIKLMIISTGNILDAKVIKGDENLTLNINEKNIDINLKHLDSSEFFLIEISHNGFLYVDGRISETGEILQTETRIWLIINIIFILFSFASVLYGIFTYLKPEIIDFKKFGLNLLVLYGLFSILRYIHRLFFIPDRISFKYLNTKDKWNKEFINEF